MNAAIVRRGFQAGWRGLLVAAVVGTLVCAFIGLPMFLRRDLKINAA